MRGEPLIRIQDCQGRGPWRPGFSKKWIDLKSDAPLMPPAFIEFPDFESVVLRAHNQGKHIGCAFIGWDGVRKWLLPHEIDRLRALGFLFVNASQCDTLLKSENQAVVASSRPLTFLPAQESGE